jgi:hypothetical protein
MLKTIYEIKLEKNFGYCLVCVRSYEGSHIGASLAIAPLDFFSIEPSTLKSEALEQLDELAAPTLSFQKPPTRGAGKWRKLHQFVDDGVDELPVCFDDVTQKSNFISDWNEIDWKVIYNMDTTQKKSCRFCEIAHLPEWSIGNSKYILTNFTMLWMYIKGEDINVHYDTSVNWTNEQYLYKKVQNIRLYSEVPREYRNKVWEEGCNP